MAETTIGRSSSMKRRYDEGDDGSRNCVGEKISRSTKHNDNERHRPENSRSTEKKHKDDPADIVHFNKLNNLANNIKDSDEVLRKLLNPRFGFLCRLERGTKNVELTELLIKVIAIACQAKDQYLLLKFLNCANGSTFILSDVPSYLIQVMSTSENTEDKTEILCGVIQILNILLNKFPRKSLPIVSLVSATVQYICESKQIAIPLTALNALEAELTNARNCIKHSIPTRDIEEEEPCSINVDDFKLLSVNPTLADIKGTGDEYLRKNKIFGRYENANDYLDVHFRLLREDFIRPLREGLADLLQFRKEVTYGKSNLEHRPTLKVYHKLNFISFRFSENAVIYKFRFDVSRMKRVLWESGKRLKFGSLVCLSKDQFQTMLIGTIAGGTVKELARGITYLSFGNEIDQLPELQSNCFYEMIESPAYYEPYKNVLSALQSLADSTLPFQKYLLNHSFDDISPPKYQTRGVALRLDFSCLTGKSRFSFLSETDEESNDRVSLQDTGSWPSAERLGLDASQYSALKTALTTEFAVIQGPPGTGKTFIGVIIVQLLLANRRQPLEIINEGLFYWHTLWHTLWEGPILIICYTNHALDQFLEDIFKRLRINFINGNIVRVGGCSKSKNRFLQQCNLRNIIYRNKKGRIETENKQSAKDLKYCFLRTVAFEELAREEILHVTYLQEFMSDGQFEMLVQYHHPDSPSVLSNWLDDGKGNYWLNQHTVSNKNSKNSVLNGRDFVNLDDWHEGCDENEFKADHSEFEKDFRRIKEDMRHYEFLNASPPDPYYSTKLQTLRRIRQTFDENEPFDFPDVWCLRHKDRWRLYNHWVKSAIASKKTEREQILQELSQVRLNLENELEQDKVDVLAKADIIAMTTTCAAKNNEILRRVGPKIVIVEEAAEVLESHVIASLTKDCEHLILIGDHLQLRPEPSDYHLGKHNHLQVSLFERMVLNGMQYETLNIQHRMRPDISELLVPHIYKSLQNHQKVTEYGDIARVHKNVFFVDHSFPEESLDDNDGHSNEHEATFLAEFCKYLLNIGYGPRSITVLTAYTGQLFLLRNYLSRQTSEGVCITSIDNYQGEENDIILLSLVRSNTKCKAGFLSIPNRICVALSRARKGLYIIGNASLLRDVSPVWRDILDTLKKDGRLADSLPIGCRNHIQQVRHVKVASDFESVPQYGCSLPCEYRLDCGHVCDRRCHPFDLNHKTFTCKKPCSRINKSCPDGHLCQRLCHEHCGPCMFVVERTLSRCQHTVKMECHMNEIFFQCSELCNKTCVFGHPCKKKCSEVCGTCVEPVKRNLDICQHEVTISCHMSEMLHEVKCEVMVKRTLITCGHTVTIPCWESMNLQECHERCKNVCPLGHQCPKSCHEDYGQCQQMKWCQLEVQMTCSKCGHKGLRKCHQEEVECQRPCKKSLLCGHICQEICGAEECTVQCKVIVKRKLQCGHFEDIFCYEDPRQIKGKGLIYGSNNKERFLCDSLDIPDHNYAKFRKKNGSIQQTGCANVCDTKLPCGHRCQKICRVCHTSDNMHGNCEEVCNKYHRLCSHRCTQKCGHPAKEFCFDTYTIACRHSFIIDHMCSDPYEACLEQCPRNCRHHRCQEPCGHPCKRTETPCNISCAIYLQCGHNCLGLCGEPCPQICRLCNRGQLQEIEKQLAIKLTEESKLLLLRPCGHVVECNFMDNWVKKRMRTNPSELHASNFLDCPICQTRVVDCPRYNRQMKEHEMHLNMAKKRIQDSKSLSEKISQSLLFNDIGVDLNVKLEERDYRLGVFYLCYLIRQLLKSLAKSFQLSGYREYLSFFETRFQGGKSSSEDKEISPIVILNLYRIYLEIQVFRLKSMPNIEEPRLTMLEECENTFSSLPVLDPDVQAGDPDAFWKAVGKVNKILSSEFYIHEKDSIGDYILFLNQCFDLELNARYTSIWFCCTKGHVYSSETELSDVQIDENCPDCYPMPTLILQSLRKTRDRLVQAQRNVPERTDPDQTNGARESDKSRKVPRTSEQNMDDHSSTNRAKSNRNDPRSPKEVKSKIDELSSKPIHKQAASHKRFSPNNFKSETRDYETRVSRENIGNSSRKRSFVEQDNGRRHGDLEREENRKRARSDDHRPSSTQRLDQSSFRSQESRHPRENSGQHHRQETRGSHPRSPNGGCSTGYRPRPSYDTSWNSRDPRLNRSSFHGSRGDQDFDGRLIGNLNRRQVDRSHHFF